MIETETDSRRPRGESRERAAETRESKEKETDKELQAAARMERADYLVREVKSSQTQVKNIILHMQEVMAAIQALRQELKLNTQAPADASVTQDNKRVTALRRKIAAYREELLKMKDDLVEEHIQELRSGAGTSWSEETRRVKADEMVAALLKEIEE